jgi:hypothetical protein
MRGYGKKLDSSATCFAFKDSSGTEFTNAQQYSSILTDGTNFREIEARDENVSV